MSEVSISIAECSIILLNNILGIYYQLNVNNDYFIEYSRMWIVINL